MIDPPKTQGYAKARGRKTRSPLRVLVVRHAIAKEAAEFAQTGAPDAERPLTKAGRRKMRSAAVGLATLVPDVGAIASSPLTRAIETADIVAKRFSKLDERFDTQRLAALSPGKPFNLLIGWLNEQPRDKAVMVIGHEPHLSQFVSFALTGLRDSFIELKKGGAILLEFDQEVRPGRAKLIWALRPKQLREIGAAAGE